MRLSPTLHNCRKLESRFPRNVGEHFARVLPWRRGGKERGRGEKKICDVIRPRATYSRDVSASVFSNTRLILNSNSTIARTHVCVRACESRSMIMRPAGCATVDREAQPNLWFLRRKILLIDLILGDYRRLPVSRSSGSVFYVSTETIRSAHFCEKIHVN